MGTIQHDAVIVVTDQSMMPDLDAFRASIPERFRPLVVGPIPAVINHYATAAFLPDGSKEGWADSDEGDRIRALFVALFGQRFSDGSSWHDAAHVSFGEEGMSVSDPRDASPVFEP